MLMLCLVCAVAGPVMPGAGDVSTMDPTMAYGAAPNMIVFAPDGGAGSAFGMNTASSHEFEFEYGEFGVFKFMIIRRHSIQTHDNFAVKNS